MAIVYMTKQADSDTPSGRDRPVLITPAMIEAGVSAYDRFHGSYDPWMLVREVYVAMASAPES